MVEEGFNKKYPFRDGQRARFPPEWTLTLNVAYHYYYRRDYSTMPTIQTYEGGVVHQVCKITTNPFVRTKGQSESFIPAKEVYKTSCHNKTSYELDDPRIDHEGDTTQVTCKACLRALGIRSLPQKQRRYVLKHKVTGYYFKKKQSTYEIVDSLLKATLYLNRPREYDNNWVAQEVEVSIVEKRHLQ
jgi:hypothetical protein